MITVTPATTDDLRAVEGQVPYTARAVKVEIDGKAVGIGGVYYMNDNVVAFSHAMPESNARARVRAAREIMRVVEGVKAPVYAVQSPTESTAPTLLAHYGFERVNDNVWRRG